MLDEASQKVHHTLRPIICRLDPRPPQAGRYRRRKSRPTSIEWPRRSAPNITAFPTKIPLGPGHHGPFRLQQHLDRPTALPLLVAERRTLALVLLIACVNLANLLLVRAGSQPA